MILVLFRMAFFHLVDFKGGIENKKEMENKQVKGDGSEILSQTSLMTCIPRQTYFFLLLSFRSKANFSHYCGRSPMKIRKVSLGKCRITRQVDDHDVHND